MITFSQKGDFGKLDRFFNRALHAFHLAKADEYGKEGVRALRDATPVDSGMTRECWSYDVTYTDDSCTISFSNSNVNEGVPIAIILQYGHGTRNGGYVQGRDYINPAIQPIFDRMAENAWKEVCKA